MVGAGKICDDLNDKNCNLGDLVKVLMVLVKEQ